MTRQDMLDLLQIEYDLEDIEDFDDNELEYLVEKLWSDSL
jgi:hypothetical protein